MGLLLRNGTMITADRRWTGDLRCRDGRIAELGDELEPVDGEATFDATGLLVFPGGVDPHVHLSLLVAGTVSADDFASGSAAALAGGTTTLIDFVHPERGESFVSALDARLLEAERSLVDYGLHLGVTWWGDGTAEEMRRCVLEEGVPSFKVYLAYKGTVGIDDRDLVQVMAEARTLGATILVHAEHGEIIELLRDRMALAGLTAPRYHALSRPPETEEEATARMAMLAGLTGATTYVVHVTCAEAAAAIARARERGVEIVGETCPQYLLLDDAVYDRPDFAGAAFVVSPPIRPRGHQTALWKALAAGTLQVVATDHCPFTQAQKAAGRDDFRRIPGGAAGIEHRLSLLWTFGVGTGRIDAHRFVDLVSTRPAKLFGLYPRKGAIAVGSDADLVLWDPGATATISAATHRHRNDASIYEGFEIEGAPAAVVARGELRYRDGQILAEPGSGRFLVRQPNLVR
ncbi:MAG: dihydropyrimidinase [Holophagales bacterium]|nr:MAG: dihydropyrimidinase [Holophagales bacterium]